LRSIAVNIIVCVKQVPDLESPIEIDKETNWVRSRQYVVSPNDMLAVEQAVRIKERKGSGRVTLVCIGPPSAEKMLQTCLSMGADEAVLLHDPLFDNSDSHATAAVLAKAISSMPYDLVLCGQMAADTQAGQVGAILAEVLHIPWVSSVQKAEISSEVTTIKVYRRLEGGNTEIAEVTLPAVLAIETGLIKPRYPALRAIMAARTKSVQEYDLMMLGLSANEVGVRGSKTRVLNISRARPQMKRLFTPDSSLPAVERVMLLMSGGITERGGDVSQGAPGVLASRLVQFLAQRKFLSRE
jgi:electron transfer flavoprotein beta subunit